MSAVLESCTAPVPETLITTHKLRLPEEDERNAGGLPADLTLVKACKQEHAIEHFPSVRLSRLGFFREDRSSLVWDMQEGVVTSEPLIEERHDDPRDIEEQQQIDATRDRPHPFVQAASELSAPRMTVKSRHESSLVYGDNCLIYCTAIEPRNSREWTRLEASFEEEAYDHYSPIRQPDAFARALGLMAFNQKGLLGNSLELRLSENGPALPCRNLSVVHGPVAYVQDRNNYIRQSSNVTEFILRCIFAKARGNAHQDRYQDQREYRFAILTAGALDYPTLDLTISTEMREAMKEPNQRRTTGRGLSLSNDGFDPSPQSPVNLSGWPSLQASAPRSLSVLSAQLHGSFPIVGVHHKSEKTTRKALQTAKEVDHRIIDQSIADEPRRSDDARLVKFILDGGPGRILGLYCLEGLDGTCRLARGATGLDVSARLSVPENAESRPVFDATQFEGTFNLDPAANQLILSVRTMNAAAVVKIDPPDTTPDLPGHYVRLSKTEDTQITVTVTSKDGTATSRLAVSIARDLHMDLDAS